MLITKERRIKQLLKHHEVQISSIVLLLWGLKYEEQTEEKMYLFQCSFHTSLLKSEGEMWDFKGNF